MATILDVIGREILDSRGNPTVEVEVTLSDGSRGIGRSPSGASTGSHEAKELRDEDANRYMGKGVQTAVAGINDEIAHALKRAQADKQAQIDQRLIELDGTDDKSRLGSNAILATSLAVAAAAASSLDLALYQYLHQLHDGASKLTLPIPMMNIINGGKHADNPLDVQEFMVIPHGFERLSEAIRAGVEVYHSLKAILHKSGQPTSVGDEGGFSPKVTHVAQVFDYILSAIEQAGYQPGKEISLGADIAASELYDPDHSSYRMEGHQKSAAELLSFYTHLLKAYPIISLEDPFHEDDWVSWQKFTTLAGHQLQIVGDDLFVTDIKRLLIGIENQSANAILIKVNQIGTLTETLACIDFATTKKYRSIISHRSGETEDSFISDLAVGTGVGQIKTGAPNRGERTAKYNQLLRIEHELADDATYASIFK